MSKMSKSGSSAGYISCGCQILLQITLHSKLWGIYLSNSLWPVTYSIH